MTRTQPVPTRTGPTGIVRAVQATAALSVLALLWQSVTAGQLLTEPQDPALHGAGAIALHIATGLLLIATVLHVRAGGARWPAVLAAAVFVATFVQAAVGSDGNMAAHVPGALVVTVGVVWLTAWAFRRQPAA
ncbi:hypothetical protein [Modestobacter roseus]|uniref:Uncharacterized protein n=1 Tax=Modestobacter roseus TaxID=1181884 RepID=A0A562IXE4_9ACTN|nr:hypothetical protein [Modestobacter roseus]MQA33987.1 hypothetical protein [Modestobacter roseus]TWH75536.1 hypothetical protein JD78_04098 [Modestobacter roseus]